MNDSAVTSLINRAIGGAPGTKSTASPFVPTPLASNIPKPATASSSANDSQIAALLSQSSSLQAQLAAMQRQIAQTPKYYSYDFAANSAKARQEAESHVNPYYQKLLSDFLNGQNQKKTDQQAQSANQTAQIEDALGNTLSANETARTRSTEDTATNLTNLAGDENYFQNTDATQFDRARSALQGQVAQSGLLTSGLGRQQDTANIADRNTQSDEKTRSFNVQRDAVNTMKTRTFEDLASSDTSNTKTSGLKKDAVQIDLDSALHNIDLDTNQYTTQNEYKRLQDIYDQQAQLEQSQKQQFVQGLAGSGARAQDIAYTSQLLGL